MGEPGASASALLLHAFRPELDAQLTAGQIQRGRVRGIPVSLQSVAPAALLAQGQKLMLADDVSREAIGVGLRLPLGRRERVDLPMRLLERLADGVSFEPVSPRLHPIDGGR